MLRDLFGRRAEPSKELSSALADLDRLARDRPELESPARSLSLIIAAVFAEDRGRRPEIFGDDTRADVIRSLADGRHSGPIVAQRLRPDALNHLALAACSVLRGTNPASDSVRSVLRDDRGRLARWAGYALTDRGPELIQDVATLGLDPALCSSILRLALLPILSPWIRTLAELPEILNWHRGTCPCCGDWPTLAESRGLEGLRFLRCGRCSGDWPAPRLRCPFCGEGDAHALCTLAAEGEELRYRLVRCASCGSGLKVVATLTPLSAPGLLVAELAMVHLDFIQT